MALFRKKQQQKDIDSLISQFKLITGYSAQFSSFDGGIYELDLIRSSVDSIATQCAKLNPIVCRNDKSKYSKYQNIENMLQNRPNSIMTWFQFVYKLITIAEIENNAFIVPILNEYEDVVGVLPVSSRGAQIIEYDGQYWLKYIVNNYYYYCEYDKVGHFRKHFYDRIFSGSSNSPMRQTVELINTQNQGIEEGIKNSASIRFLARLSNVIRPDKMDEERKLLRESNLNASNNGGVMLFDNKYADVKEINSRPFIVDAEQQKVINSNVFNYFHVNEDIIQNKADENTYNAFYEGKIEPHAIQIGQILTNMFFNENEIKRGIHICLESSKLQFASASTKLSVSQQLFDRGILTINMVNDIWNFPHVEDGDKRYIRKEYAEIGSIDDLDKNDVDNQIDTVVNDLLDDGGNDDGSKQKESESQKDDE